MVFFRANGINNFIFMTALYKTGRNMYLLGIVELAIYNFDKGDFAMTRPPPWPDILQGTNPSMAYASGALLIISVLIFFFKRYQAAALLTIANLIFWVATTRHVYNLWRDHINGFKTLWLIGGALLILTSTVRYTEYKTKAIWLNLIILFLFFVDCGIAHFKYVGFVQSLIPSFIPFPIFFTYFAGVCLVAAGVGLLFLATQKLAALLSGIQIAGWFILLHIPRALTLGGDEWIGVGESLAISGICFMIYEELKNKASHTIV